MTYFKDKTLLICGGTGSFGGAVLRRLLCTDIAQIRIFSRDEKKQDDMRHEYQRRYPGHAEKLRFYIGDVRSRDSVREAVRGADLVFQASALKQVPSCEFFPMEAVRTNIIGTDNLLAEAVEAETEAVVCLSTDKAVYPINAMGMSKALMEKNAAARSRTSGRTKICCTRYGNVLCSRGSVLPLWIEQIKTGSPLTLTQPEMTRFVMTLDEAVELVTGAFEKGRSGDLLVRRSPACTMGDMARALLELFGADNEIRIIGIRHGEKMHETLLTGEERARAEELGDCFRVPCDNRSLNYDEYFSDGDASRANLAGYDSKNAPRLDLAGIKAKLAELEYVKAQLERWRRDG